MSRPKIANRTEEVLRGDGVRLYGMDAEIELKMQAKRDLELEDRLRDWLEQVSGMKFSHPDDFGESLKSGILLCTVINAIWPGAIKTINKKPIALMEMENIGYYLKACWKLGVPSSELFVVSDLYLKKSIPSVVQNIYSLSRIAQNASNYKGPKIGPPVQHQKPAAKKWETINVGGPRFVTDEEDYEAEAPPLLTSGCPRCGLPVGATAKHCSGCGTKIVRPEGDPELKKKLSEAEAYRDKLEKELKELKEMYQREVSEKQNLQRDLDSLKARSNSNASAASAAAEQEIKSLKQQLESEVNSKKKSLQELNELQAQNRTLKSQLTEQESKTKKLEEDIRKLQRENNKTITSPKNASASADLAEAKRLLDEAQKENSRLQSNLREKETQVRSLQEQLQKTKPTPSPPAAASGKKSTRGPLVGMQSLRNMDQRLLVELQDSLTRILFSEPIDFPDVSHLNDFFKSEAGRRLFTQCMKQTMKTVPSLTISENNFELLLYLINTVLQMMDMSDSKDLMTAKVLMVSSRVISRVVDGNKKEYLKHFIKGHEIWKNLAFWEEQFWEQLSQKFKDEESKYEGSLAPLVVSFVPSFALQMLEWGNNASAVQNFISDMCVRYEVDLRRVPLLKVDPTQLLSHLQHQLGEGTPTSHHHKGSKGPAGHVGKQQKTGSFIKFW